MKDGDVYDVVRAIPLGKVMPYGQIGVLLGAAGQARRVGQALSHAPGDPALPCHRVVGASGSLTPGWPEQKTLLESEGVTFTPMGRVRMKKHLWRPFG